ncbi:unnamed protein product [Brassica napus]|uniref:NYN domain-containing protein n=3 Tax=Brassica TaxID=3705 RepID=A0A0D3BXM9_BRAOL|nr:unnamed protein product [Brassica napus]VDD09693.1 unnamed protein product [Brassica oleracea]
MDDSPIPDGLDPTSVLEFIKGAFENMGYLGRLIKIRAYCKDRSKLISYCDAAGILSQNRVSKVGYAEVDHMLVDILTWGLYNRAPSNLMWQNTGVFWNLDDCETPDDTDIYQNVKSALANQGCHGQVSIWAYCEEDKEPIPGITLVSAEIYAVLGDETARFKKMLRDILFWALQNPVHHRRTTVPSLTVISNISRNIEFAHVLQLLASRDYNVLLTVPDKKEYICSVWLYPCLIQSQIKFPSCTRLDKSLHVSGDPDMKLNTMFLDILLYMGIGQSCTIKFAEAGSPVIPPACLEWRLDTLLAGGNPINRTNYSRDVLNMIQNDLSFRRKDCDEANTAVFWDIEDCPIPGGMDPLTFLQNIKLALVNHGCHVNVSIMAYCDKNRSLEDFSLSDTSPITLVPTGDKYARIKKMFRDIFLWALANPQTSSVMVVITKSMPWHISDVPCDAFESRNYNLVLADPYAVGYVNSVWLSTSLFGGGNPIDLKERKDHRSPIML